MLVTGAGGYIGSHAALELLRAGYAVVSLDSYVRGHAASLDAVQPVATEHGRTLTRVKADVRDTGAVERAIADNGATAVMHFAAYAQVGESVAEPLLYWHNNTGGTVSLLEAIDAARGRGVAVDRLVVSSTCATYGEPGVVPIDESVEQRPVNPYGASKLAMEQAVRDYVASRSGTDNPLGAVMLRYFNVAGCDPGGLLGEDAVPQTRVVPILLEAALGVRDGFTVFGDDYPTPDGTAVRDYVHVTDLVRAHVLGLERMKPGACEAYNVGTGRGYSVRELVDAAKAVTGVDFAVGDGPRRPGDPSELVSDASRVREAFEWEPRFVEPRKIIETAWAWFQKNPNGYAVKGG